MADALLCALFCLLPVHRLLERARLRSRTVGIVALPRQSLGRYGRIDRGTYTSRYQCEIQGHCRPCWHHGDQRYGLEFCRHVSTDRLPMTARLLSKQGPGEEAEQAWRALIQCNPDNTGYYDGIFSSKNIKLGEFCQVFLLATFIN